MTTYIQIWCEYDIGVTNIIFTGYKPAYSWLQANNEYIKQLGCMEENETFIDLINQGLIGFLPLTLIT